MYVARATACANNQKQLGLCLAMYNDDYLQLPTAGVTVENWGMISWDDLIAYGGRYDGRSLTWSEVLLPALQVSDGHEAKSALYRCPFDPIKRKGQTKHRAAKSYGAAMDGIIIRASGSSIRQSILTCRLGVQNNCAI